MHRSRIAYLVAASMVPLIAASAANASYVFGNFEDGTTDGFGSLNGPGGGGVQPFSTNGGSPTVSITSGNAGTDATHVLDVVGAGYNGGQSGGTDVGYDFTQNGAATEAAFMANDILTFNWEVPVSSTTGGYNQLYQIVLNAPGLGYTAIGGSSVTDNSTDDQNPPYTGQLNTFSVNYDTYKAEISANPSYIQLGIVTNNGGGAPAEVYLDNFTLSSVPEPASLSVLGLAVGGLLVRRRR